MKKTNLTEIEVLSLEKAKLYIYSIDFSLIIDKMVKYDTWLPEDVEKTCQLYRNFLWLKKKYESTDIKIPPSKDVDDFWHYHILDTEKYRMDCQNIFGYYLHHHPTYPGPEGDAKLKRLGVAFEKLQQIHLQEFGEMICATRASRSKWVNDVLHKIYSYRQKMNAYDLIRHSI